MAYPKHLCQTIVCVSVHANTLQPRDPSQSSTHLLHYARSKLAAGIDCHCYQTQLQAHQRSRLHCTSIRCSDTVYNDLQAHKGCLFQATSRLEVLTIQNKQVPLIVLQWCDTWCDTSQLQQGSLNLHINSGPKRHLQGESTQLSCQCIFSEPEGWYPQHILNLQ